MKNWEKEFDKNGFRNQAIIKGMKRIELKQFIRILLDKQREEIKEKIEKTFKNIEQKSMSFILLSRFKFLEQVKKILLKEIK